MSKENEGKTKPYSSLERGVIELRTIIKENNENISRIKEVLEKLGLTIVNSLGNLKDEIAEIKKLFKKIDSFEVTLRGLRFTTKDTLEKLVERVLELEKIIKKKPKVESIVVEEVSAEEEKKKLPEKKREKEIASQTATENTLNSLIQIIKDQVPASELINKIAETRDTLMSWTPHHPVFYEMFEWMQKIKHYPKKDPIPPKEAEKLLNDMGDWLKRLLKKR
ncbi:MAG: hypothetical protein ACTSYQ_02265 [Candidatus Odinarchaeia archaeon]